MLPSDRWTGHGRPPRLAAIHNKSTQWAPIERGEEQTFPVGRHFSLLAHINDVRRWAPTQDEDKDKDQDTDSKYSSCVSVCWLHFASFRLTCLVPVGGAPLRWRREGQAERNLIWPVPASKPPESAWGRSVRRCVRRSVRRPASQPANQVGRAGKLCNQADKNLVVFLAGNKARMQTN